jgi:hypothetical protein
LWADGTINGSGDAGVYINPSGQNSYIRIKGCSFNGGAYGPYIHKARRLEISGNHLNEQVKASVYTGSVDYEYVRKNTVVDFVYQGIDANGSDHFIEVSNNQMTAKNDSTSSDISGIHVTSPTHARIENNSVNITNTRSGGSDLITAIGAGNATGKVHITNNYINLDSDVGGAVNCININSLNDSVISGNSIFSDCSSATTKGIDLNDADLTVHSERNNISNNIIDLTHSTADEIGIYIDSNCDDNYGDGNIIINCGTNVDDTNGGTGNNIGFQAA